MDPRDLPMIRRDPLPSHPVRLERRRPHRRRLLDLIERFQGVGIAVLGDFMLDEFVYGEIARVSREAPVLILEHRESRFAPGGAGNTVANLRALGALPFPIGRIGRDEPAERLLELLDRQRVDCSGIVRDAAYVTPVKTRILAGSPHTAKQQVVRIDHGTSAAPPSAPVRSRISRCLARARPSASGLLIADYGYGSVDSSDPQLRRWLSDDGASVNVDSRFRVLDFPGVTAATPNIAEVEAAIGVSLPDEDLRAIERAGAKLLEKLRARAVLVTRGSQGMSVFEKGHRPEHDPVELCRRHRRHQARDRHREPRGVDCGGREGRVMLMSRNGASGSLRPQGGRQDRRRSRWRRSRR
ncbi:MAG: sugar kinase [Acidobacteria bacterium]|nr:MAG: sugar kinase [Acidobacteriota bacterium]